jgi:hypothetical protein
MRRARVPVRASAPSNGSSAPARLRPDAPGTSWKLKLRAANRAASIRKCRNTPAQFSGAATSVPARWLRDAPRPIELGFAFCRAERAEFKVQHGPPPTRSTIGTYHGGAGKKKGSQRSRPWPRRRQRGRKPPRAVENNVNHHGTSPWHPCFRRKPQVETSVKNRGTSPRHPRASGIPRACPVDR